MTDIYKITPVKTNLDDYSALFDIMEEVGALRRFKDEEGGLATINEESLSRIEQTFLQYEERGEFEGYPDEEEAVRSQIELLLHIFNRTFEGIKPEYRKMNLLLTF